ncbi:NrfD/PsrC family molybdoenzyme membrane anchor subunit [Mesoterricola silvestris]|uniref:Cytochrome c nitrite reductase subunit NrfD n=1 Tax=Mesoterricola silvestris TaxID=2927979 RepID=A0AA48GIC4_9BACT|nr:NrfD/PsrC family molybdoenzyme membrane anchor subunit [Mesoterricola silvestris]BDU73481.1 cytochrome c nitrite reductase subunit NrfD [Mesoterricola silvestris]
MREPVWEFLIVNYLFLGGLSAGIFFVSAFCTWLQTDGKPVYPRIARTGALLAPWPVALGSFLLIFDLGKWWRFWKLFVIFRWESPMSIGSWLLLVFTGITLVNLFAWLTEDERNALFARIPARTPGRARILALNRDLGSWKRRLAMLGFPFAIGVGIYTGVLLGAVQARPFWNTNLVAQLFLFSALSTGTAALILARMVEKGPRDLAEFRFLYTLDICLILLEFFIVLPYLIHGQLSVLAVREALSLVLGGPFTFIFWGLFLGAGLLLPLAIELWEFKPVLMGSGTLHITRGLAMTAAGLVIFGGYVLRYVFVFAGQASGFR